MRFFVTTQVFSMFAVLSLCVEGEAESFTRGVSGSENTRTVFKRKPHPFVVSDTRRGRFHTLYRSLPKATGTSKGDDFVANPSAGAPSTAGNRSPGEPPNPKPRLDAQTTGALEPEQSRAGARLGIQNGGSSVMEQAGSINPHKGNNAEPPPLDSEGSQNNKGNIPNTRCSDGVNVRDMYRAIQALSSNVDGLLQQVQSASDSEPRLQSRMDIFDTRLLEMDQKLDQFLSEHQSTSQNIQQVAQSAEQTTFVLSQLRDFGSRKGQAQGRTGAARTSMGDSFETLDALKGTLESVLNKISTVYNEESTLLSLMQNTLSHIGHSVNNLSDSLNVSSDDSAIIEAMQDNLQRLQQTIVYALRSEIATVVETLNSLNIHVSDVGSLGEQLRVSLDILYDLGRSLSSIGPMVTEIKERVFKGCKIHVKGKAGDKVQLTQGQKAEILSQKRTKNKETSQSKRTDETADTWKNPPVRQK